MRLKFLILPFLFYCSLGFSQESLIKERASYFNIASINSSLDVGFTTNNDTLFLYKSVTSSEAQNISILSGATQPNYGGGDFDAYIEKRAPNGDILWNTFIGGEGRDGIKIEPTPNGIYLFGETTSQTTIATPGTFMEDFKVGYNNQGLIIPNGFIMKLDNSGNKVWGTYFRTTDAYVVEHITDFTVDESGNLYLVGLTQSTENVSTTDAYENSLGQAIYKAFIEKFDADGNRLWGTYYGPSGPADLTVLNNIALGQNGNIVVGGYFLGSSNPPEYFSTRGTYNDGQNSGPDVFLAKFDPEGDRLWGLLYGGSNFEHSIDVAVDSQNNIVWFGSTESAEDIASPGAYQETFGSSNPINAKDDAFLAKFNESGARMWSTYYGGHEYDSYGDGTGHGEYGTSFKAIALDENDNIYIAAQTTSVAQIATDGTYQDNLASTEHFDAYVAKFTSGGNRLWGTYFGGQGDENDIGILYTGNQEFYLYGLTNSTSDIATPNAWWDTSLENDSAGFIAKFKPNPLGVPKKSQKPFSLWPNPASKQLTITGKSNQPLQLSFYDMQGRLVKKMPNVQTNQRISLRGKLSSGLYFVNIATKEKKVQTVKLVVE